MADAGSFNADLGINMQFNIDNTGLVEVAKTIKEISKGKDLQRYWKDVETATDNAVKAMNRYSRNTDSKGAAENFIKQINALKALTKKENLSELFPNSELNIDGLLESAKKIAPKINAEFSVTNFSQAFNTFDLLKEKGLDLRQVFSMLADYADMVNKNFELREENNQFRQLIGDSDVSDVKSKLSEIKKLRDEAESIFESFLKVNNIERTDFWGNENFPEYFDEIRKGSLTASEAIAKFKTDNAHLLEESFRSNNDTFGLEQLQAFSNKLESIFRQVEETSSKINDIILNGVITKSVENLSSVGVDKSNISSENATATEEAAQAQKDFATANEKAQSSADGSKTPLQLEAELMESIAKNAREAANAKKEFTEANKQVKDSAESSSTSIDEEKRSVDNVGDSVDEVKKKLDDVVFKPNTEGFDEIVAKLNIAKDKINEISKITKSSVWSESQGKYLESYNIRYKNGSTEIRGESSNKQGSNVLRSNEVAYDAKAVEQEAKAFNQAWEEAIKVNNALNETKSILSSLPRTTGLDDEFTSLHTRLLNLNNDLTSGKISVSDYTKEVKSLTSSYSEMFESQQRQADNQKLEQQNRIYQELNDKINRYATVSKRIAGKTAYSTDEEEAARLQARIEELRNEPLLSEEQLDKSQRKLDEIETTLEDIQKHVVNTTLDNLQGDIDNYYKRYDKYSIKPKDVDRNPQYTKDLEEYKSVIDKIAAEKERIAGLNLEVITEDDLKNVRKLESDLAKIEKRVKGYSAAEKGSDEQSRLKQIDKINKYLEENTRISQEAKYKLRELLQTLENDGAAANVKKINEEFIRITNNELAAGRAGKSFMDVLKDKKFYSFAGQIASYFSFYDVINVIRRGAQEVRELNKALTEMRKVSDESLSSLKEYQNISFDMGDEVGTTGKQIMESTADWLRLGESMKEASKSASTSNILLNVSEFESIDEATESLVSMSQAYKDLDKIEIVDVLNNLGNNYAISTDGLATALKDSASALKTAQNDYYEAAALATAANTVVQDPSKVGAGLRTISLRLTGTEEAKKELEDLGEDVSDFQVATVSKLNQQIKDLTRTQDNLGVSLLDMNGNYRSTYDILLDIAKVWDTIKQEDLITGENRQNALLEMMAGDFCLEILETYFKEHI